MERRELLKTIALLTGGVVIGGDIFLSGCNTNTSGGPGFSAANIALLDEVGETIIPTTSTPGAKAAKIGEFMKVIVTDCYNEAQQKVFMDGMAGLDAACKKASGKTFLDSNADERKAFLIALEKEAKEYNKARDEKEKEAREKAKASLDPNFVSAPSHYYTMMKQLTLWGYFSSEIGSKQALRWLPIPGKYDGAFPYKKGDKAWAI
jgi:hypothetical protein